MQITHARTNDSLRRSRARRASLLGWLPVAAAVALSGCTVKKTEAPDITGPSELGLSLELRVSPDVLGDGRRLAVDADHHVARLERQGPAERRRPRRGDAPAARSSTSSAGCRRRTSRRAATAGATVTYTAPNSAPSQNSDSGNIGRDADRDPGRLRLPQRARPAGGHPAGAAGRHPAAGVRRRWPKFTMSPTAPGEEQDVIFDASRVDRRRACRIRPNPNDATKCTPGDGDDHLLPVGLRQRPDRQRRARHDALPDARRATTSS